MVLTKGVISQLPLVLVTGATLVALMAGARFTGRPRPRVLWSADQHWGTSFVCGVWWSALGFPWRATAPLARLRICNKGLRIGPNTALLSPFIPTWDFAWKDLEAVESGQTIRLRSSSDAAPVSVLMWQTSHRRQAMDCIQQARNAGEPTS